VRGKSETGKSSLTRLIAPLATKTISLDTWLALLSQSSEAPTPLLAHLAANFNQDDIEQVCTGIDIAGLTNEYVDILVKGHRRLG
jgi:hypothetical protein